MFEHLIKKWGRQEQDLDSEQAKKESLDLFNINKASFIAQTKTLYNLDLVNVIGDGNCFFHAIVQQLQLRDPEIIEIIRTITQTTEVDHHLLRQLAVGSFCIHQKRAFSPDAYIHNITAYINGQSTDATWAEGDIIRMMAHVLGTTLVLVNNNNRPTVISEGPHTVLYLAYHVGVHFDALSGEPSEHMQRLIPAVSTDLILTERQSAILEAWDEVRMQQSEHHFYDHH